MKRLMLGLCAVVLGLVFALPAQADRDGVVRFATLPKPGPGHPEGLAADSQGNLYVATFDSTTTNRIYVFGGEGNPGDGLREMLELSIVRSDNTSSDKLLELVGGPGALTRRLTALGISGVTIRRSIREFLAARDRPHPNTASALALARLLSRLQKGEILRADSRETLFGFMSAATTGLHRLRGGLPEGTAVGDKTGSGSGPNGSVTNDVGIITLPEGKGHLAMAVLISGSKRPVEAQEKLIADVARAVYDANISAR